MKPTFLLLVALSLLANELLWVDQQIDAIKPKRTGIENKKIEALQSPVFLTDENAYFKDQEKLSQKKLNVSSSNPPQPKKKKTRHKPALNAIINNSVLLNNHWYQIGDTVDGYKIIKIIKYIVILQNRYETITLSTKSENNNIIIQRQ